MARNSGLVACLILWAACVAAGHAVAADVTGAAEPVDRDLAKTIISERLGVRVTVVEAHQINVRPPRAQEFRGGLCIVLLSGPLASAANLHVGDVIVKIDDMEVTDLDSALHALRRADDSDKKTRLSFVRTGMIRHKEILVGPSIHEGRTGAPTARFTSRRADPLMQQYLEKSELLSEEQQELARLQKANELQMQRRPFLDQQLQIAEQELLILDAKIENVRAAPFRDELLAQRRTLESQKATLQKQIMNSTDDKISEQIQSHRTHVRVLKHSLEKAILELRLAGRVQRDKE